MISQNPHEKICLWASMIVFNVSVAICQLSIHQFSQFGKGPVASLTLADFYIRV